ncbi:MAG: holliday junction helicase RuvA [Thermoanaerobacteraceae bacterium]|uniref:Holliday junction branch migration complex subunit RuvA n=1 Tax=Biomaibacter acetigenes TaxID=2316383 RepID=A0A3G2R5E9_9FIRM|nr:Holliday junction branch migration protein RuvA [Biomaibacter acetigenes]AYO30764.1 Holliday junction branch migration protein RuvA [Biomaibacter acetigenes]MDK2878810.1 holliday junction helicase RuvA [Thermoanaerobacteraceae bacterium]MDN5311391.1 holliday junction helicase RuvA [Thermoanaerobacteraceae bacterium]
MLDYIKGILVAAEPNQAVIDSGGRGYRLTISIHTYNSIKCQLNTQVKLYTHLILKEDAIDLLGFYDTVERQAFILLTRVPGIGMKVGMSVLSILDVAALKSAILSDDIKTLAAVPGIGKKTAQKIIIDLKDRIKDLPVDPQKDVDLNVLFQVKQALETLGFNPNEIQMALEEYSGSRTADENMEKILKNTLKILSR